MEQSKNIYIPVNSPGEIAGWLRPAAEAIKELLPDYKIYALLLPCVFASGSEKRVMDSYPQIEGVIPASDFPNMLFSREDHSRCAILHIGGDLSLSAMLARRWKISAWGYQWGKAGSDDRAFKGYFVKTDYDAQVLRKRGIMKEKIHITGDVLYDAVTKALPQEELERPFTGVNTVTFMAGSRKMEMRALIPFYLKVAHILKEKYGHLRFQALISPFINLDELLADSRIAVERGFDGLEARTDEKRTRFFHEEDDGVSIEIVTENHYLAMCRGDLVISIPGTKTGEAACLNKPMVVVMPLNRPEHIPFIGVIGLLDWIPWIGPAIKGKAILKIAEKFGFVAQPNILAEREVVPEVRGIVTPQEVAGTADILIEDETLFLEMKRQLSNIYSPFKGASDRLAELFAESVKCLEMGEMPYLSVVICSRNRKTLLKRTIETLDAQTIPSDSYEIVVVDDGSEDGTGDMIAALETRCALNYIRKDWGGRSGARNVGIEAARGKIIVFVDDDILAPEDFLRQHVRFHQRYPCSVIRGPILNIPEHEFPKDRKPGWKDYSGAFFCTCNASVPAEIIRNLGGFDETFVEYGYEDNEMGWRLSRYGLKVHFNMDGYLYHYKPYKKEEDLPAAVRNAQELARSAVMYYEKHGHWKVRLATGIHPVNYVMHKLFGRTALNNINVFFWKKAARKKNYAKMALYENKIRRYYYNQTIFEELKKKGL